MYVFLPKLILKYLLVAPYRTKQNASVLLLSSVFLATLTHEIR
jgi:hypothetical protein